MSYTIMPSSGPASLHTIRKLVDGNDLGSIAYRIDDGSESTLALSALCGDAGAAASLSNEQGFLLLETALASTAASGTGDAGPALNFVGRG